MQRCKRKNCYAICNALVLIYESIATKLFNLATGDWYSIKNSATLRKQISVRNCHLKETEMKTIDT